MVGWESYKQAILQAEEQFHKAFEEAWDWHQGEIDGLLKRPMATPEMGRVSMARAVARFWSRTEKIGMNLVYRQLSRLVVADSWKKTVI